jgi:hypothetical protein
MGRPIMPVTCTALARIKILVNVLDRIKIMVNVLDRIKILVNVLHRIKILVKTLARNWLQGMIHAYLLTRTYILVNLLAIK